MLNKPTALTLSAVLLASFLSACSKSSLEFKNSQPLAAVQAPLQVSDSFSAVESVKNDSGYLLAIRKTSLEKEFLLHASLIEQSGMPTSSGLEARVVAFKKQGHSVFMLEATQGHVVTQDLPAQLILAELPIAFETEDQVVVDFNQGMKNIFLVGNWFASDAAEEIAYSSTQVGIKGGSSFIASTAVKDNALEIRQIVQVQVPQPMSPITAMPSFEVRYFLQPYSPNPHFQPKASSDFKKMGFFEVNPRLEEGSGRPIVLTSRWSLDRPVTFHVSANTPKEFQQSVKDGILYWNTVFGREVVRAEMAPEGVTAPDPRYNVIQWVPNDHAGMAYADALMDPRTGEILHAQVYLTSVFSTMSQARGPMLARKADQQTHAHPQLTLQGFKSSRLCEREENLDQARAELDAALGESRGKVDPARFLEISRDYVRHVVSHEVGHTMGLRHNFAGSLAMNISLEKRNEIFNNYLIKGELPPEDVVVSSSVMEYSTFLNSVIEGSFLQQGRKPNPGRYDVAAIDWGYSTGQFSKNEKMPLFCTDTQESKVPDCKVFDEGASPVVMQSFNMKTLRSSLPVSFVEMYIGAKAPFDSRDQMDLTEVPVEPNAIAKSFRSAMSAQVSWLSKDGVMTLTTQRKFPYITSLNQEEAQSAQSAWVSAQIQESGGLRAALFGFFPSGKTAADRLSSEWKAQLAAYLARADVQKGTGQDGKPYELAPDEIALIEKTADAAFARVEAKVLEDAMSLITSNSFVFGDRSTEFEAELGRAASNLLLAVSEKAVSPELPQARSFIYSLDLRKKAVELISKDRGAGAADFNANNRAAIKQALQVQLETMLGQKAPFNLDLVPASARDWAKAEVDLLSSIGAAKEPEKIMPFFPIPIPMLGLGGR